MNINQLAELIYQKKWESENKGFQFSKERLDPETIAMIIQIIIKVAECYLGKDRKSYQMIPPSDLKYVWINMTNPTFFDKISLRRIIFSVLGMRGYIKESTSIYSACLSATSQINVIDLVSIVRSIS